MYNPEVTPKQMEVLVIVSKWWNTYKRSPTLREIAAKRSTGRQVRSVVQLLTYMEQKRIISRRGRKGITILDDGKWLLSGYEGDQFFETEQHHP